MPLTQYIEGSNMDVRSNVRHERQPKAVRSMEVLGGTQRTTARRRPRENWPLPLSCLKRPLAWRVVCFDFLPNGNERSHRPVFDLRPRTSVRWQARTLPALNERCAGHRRTDSPNERRELG